MNNNTNYLDKNEFESENLDAKNNFDTKFSQNCSEFNQELSENDTNLSINSLKETKDTTKNDLNHEERHKKNKKIFMALFVLALPVALQNLLSALLNIIDNLMVSSLGKGIAEPAMSGVLLVNQYIFVFQVIVFAVANSAVVYIAQFFGKGDKKNIPPAFSLALILGIGLGIIFTAISAIFPRQIIQLFFKPDAEILDYATKFLSVVAYSFLPFAVSTVLACSIRGIKKVNLALIATSIGIVFNVFFNYSFMFGKFGMPELGIRGTALGTVISRTIEMLILLLYTIFNKKYFIWTNIKEQFKITKDYVKKYFKVFLPACTNEVFWVIGNSVYLAFFSQMPSSDIGLSALSITQSVDKLIFVFIIGLGSATNVIIGNLIGAKDYDETMYQSKLIMKFTTILGLIVGALMILSTFTLDFLFVDVSAESLRTAKWLLVVFGTVMVVRARNFNYILGILRSGGDVVFTMLVESITIWVIAVPMAALGTFVFKFPIEITYILIYLEEIVKVFIIERRFRSKKWLKNLVDDI